MYLPSNSPILAGDQRRAACHAAESDARILATQQIAAAGRCRIFNALIPPNAVNDNLGIGAAVNVAKLQDQTVISRASGLLGMADISGDPGPSAAQIITSAPEVVSLNRAGSCGTPYAPVPLQTGVKPGMPQRGPSIVMSDTGPMHYRGTDATIPGTYPTPLMHQQSTMTVGPPLVAPNPQVPFWPFMEESQIKGLTGYAPPWSDAWVMQQGVAESSGAMNWIADHPWWVLAAAGAGVFALSRRGK
jgi:hypothetical protein